MMCDPDRISWLIFALGFWDFYKATANLKLNKQKNFWVGGIIQAIIMSCQPDAFTLEFFYFLPIQNQINI
jgi:hypothetical protein